MHDDNKESRILKFGVRDVMDDKNNFALVPRPSSAIEKAQPSAKRILANMVKETLSLAHQEFDATPLTLSIAGDDGRAVAVIKRNTRIPARASLILANTNGTDERIEITVVQGESSIAAKNAFLGKFIVEGVLPAAERVSPAEVIFDIDANGILHISAKDMSTGVQRNVLIKSKGQGLSKNDIERLLKDTASEGRP